MDITNDTGLPQPIVNAVSAENYDRGGADFSVSDLTRPPQLYCLARKHADELTEDAADRIWALLGKSVHYVLEHQDASCIQERRLYGMMLGNSISGQIDLYEEDDACLTDFKVTSAWSAMDCLSNGMKPEWEKQLNYYAWLCRQNGMPIKRLQIIAILRDWSRASMLKSVDYPRRNVVVLEARVWDETYLIRNLQLDIFERTCTEIVRNCTNDERWYKPGKLALMKHGRKSALKLFVDEAELKEWARTSGQTAVELTDDNMIRIGPKHYIEMRPNAYPRCEHYCEVADFCEQWKKDQGDEENQSVQKA